MNRNVKLNYSSTLDGSVLILTCENEMSNVNTSDEQIPQILSVTCHSNGNWIPNPANFTCTSFTTGIVHLVHMVGLCFIRSSQISLVCMVTLITM